MSIPRLAHAKAAARDLENNLSATYWSEHDFHLERAVDALCRFLTDGGNRDHLIDLIANAMDDVHDMDVTMDDYAKAVADAIINTAIPKGE